MIDSIVLFNFFLFIACCGMLAKRYGRTLQQEMQDERARHKRLLEYRAGLKKQVFIARGSIEKQLIVYEDLSHKIARWKERYDVQQERRRLEYEKLDHQAQQKYDQQMQAYALQKIEKRLLSEAVERVRTQLQATLSTPSASVRYNDDCLKSLKQIKRMS